MTSYDKSGFDVEKSAYEVASTAENHVSDASGAVHGESFVVGTTPYAKLQRLAGRFGVEQRGIERVPENERTDKSTVKVGTMVCRPWTIASRRPLTR